MNKSLFTSVLIATAFVLVSCGTTPDTSTTKKDTTADVTTEKQVTVTPEQKELSQKMVSAIKDLSTSQIIGNTSFKNYGKLVVKYGLEGKMDSTTEFEGKEGFVELKGLLPDTVYYYEIYDGEKKINSGTSKTQAK